MLCFLYHLLVAIISGLYTSLWGAYKDSPYEGFKPKTFPRSIYFSLAILGFFQFVSWFDCALVSGFCQLDPFHLFFFLMGLERYTCEIYKIFFRIEDQSKYFIPPRFCFFNREVHHEGIRRCCGLIFLAGTIAVALIPTSITTLPYFLLAALATGGIISLGGAYKDAFKEGFDPKKFFRSIVVVALLGTPVFYYLGPISLGCLIFTYGGFERFIVEYYKSYWIKSVPGKFRTDLRVLKKEKETREKFHRVAQVIVVLVILAFFNC